MIAIANDSSCFSKNIAVFIRIDIAGKQIHIITELGKNKSTRFDVVAVVTLIYFVLLIVEYGC